MGAGVVILFTGFCFALVFISSKNFDSELTVQAAQELRVQRVSNTEKFLIDSWVSFNDVYVPEGEGYGWIIGKYPSRPWNP